MPRDWRAERESLLLELERAQKPEDRAEAAEQLCELAHDVPDSARGELMPVVVRLLADAQPLVKSAALALAALAELKDPRALPHVRAVSPRCFPPSFERTQAAGVLARLGDREGGKHLLARAAKKWSEDRPMALELLGEVKAQGALEALRAA